ncbi:AsmA family protein [Flavilitoribacter nigricans]|nr:hypothetical protein [Flavilitoribacter nigricans]
MKKQKWWIFALVGLVAIAIAVFVAEGYLKKRIKQELQIQTTYGDTLQISKVDLGILRGWMDINDLVIRWNIPPKDSSAESLTYLIRGKIGKVQLKGLSFAQYLFRNRIQINKLLIDSSALDLHLIKSAADGSKSTPDSMVATENELAITINGMEIAPSRIRYFVGEEAKPRFEVDAISLNIEEFHYPQVSDTSSYVNHFSWEAKGLRYSRAEQFSDLLIANSSGSSQDSSLTFSQLQFLPLYSKAEYSRHLKHKDSRVEINAGQGGLKGLDWFALLSGGHIRARSFTMDSCFIEVYEDSRLPVDETRYKSLYQEKLLHAGVDISVDTAKFRHSKLTFEMRPDDPQPQVGFLNFLDLDAVLSNITNDSAEIARDPLLRAQVNTVVNGESELKAYFTFDLSSRDYAYTYSGEMHGFDLPEFNTILMETSQMKIAAGRMQRLSYRVDADKRISTGEMRMDYSDLKIEWLEGHNKLAALAQKIVMREQNPKNDNYRVGQIYHERKPFRSFWNSYLKSLLSGLNSTAMPNLFLPDELDAKKEKI